MAIKYSLVKCPACEANLSIEAGRTRCFCTYCGSQIIVTNDNEHIYRHIDEAKIKEAEANRAIQLKKLEIIEKKRASAEKSKKVKIIISIIMGILGIILLLADIGMDSMVGLLVIEFVGLIWIISSTNKEDDIDFGDKIKVPYGISDYENKSYLAIEELFKCAGFTNVRCIALHDLRTSLIKKPDTVESITINGHTVTCGGSKFPPDAAVLISYHSFVKR